MTEFLRAHCGETVAWIEVPRGTLKELLEGSRRARSKARRCRGERDSRREALCPRDFDRLQQRGKCARIVLRQVAKNDPDVGVGLRQCLGNVAMLDAQPSPPRPLVRLQEKIAIRSLDRGTLSVGAGRLAIGMRLGGNGICSKSQIGVHACPA